MANFPHTKTYNALQARVDPAVQDSLREQNADAKLACLVAFGNINRGDDIVAKQIAEANVICSMERSDNTSSPPPYPGPEPASGAFHNQSLYGRHRRRLSWELSRRSTALNEYCQRHSIRMAYDSPVKTSEDPARSSVTIRIGDRSFQGFGRSGKAAKLDAANNASTAMEMPIPVSGL